jgi:hypothetical protein
LIVNRPASRRSHRNNLMDMEREQLETLLKLTEQAA